MNLKGLFGLGPLVENQNIGCLSFIFKSRQIDSAVDTVVVNNSQNAEKRQRLLS